MPPPHLLPPPPVAALVAPFAGRRTCHPLPFVLRRRPKVSELGTCEIPKPKVYGSGVLPSRSMLMAPRCLSFTWTLKGSRALKNPMYMMIGLLLLPTKAMFDDVLCTVS